MQPPTARSLFEAHHDAVHAFLRRMTGDRATAEDLTQDVFVRVVRGLERYEGRGRDLAWLFRIARRLLIDRHRAAERRPTLVEADTELAAPAPMPGLHLDLAEALAALDEPEREAFLLREVGGLGYDEIAGLVNATPGAVRSRIHRARLALRAALQPTFIARTEPRPREITS